MFILAAQLTLSCSWQVILYDAVTRQVRRQFTRFKDKAYCGTFRADSKLLVAGGEDGIVQVGKKCLNQCLIGASKTASNHHCSHHVATMHAWSHAVLLEHDT